MPYRNPELPIDTVALAFKRFTAQAALAEDACLFDSAELRVAQDHIFGHLVYQLRTKVLTDDLPPEQFTAQTQVTFEVPTSTWQMWKKRHAHRWYARRLVARWPVRYELDPDGRGATAVCTANLARFRAYPRAKVQMPSDRFGSAVLFHAVQDLRWDFTDQNPDHLD